MLKLEVKDLLCFDDLKVEFNESELVALAGDNGSGKTSFVELLAIALYGRYSKGVGKESLIRRGCKKGGCRLDISFGDKTVGIARTFTPKEKVEIFIDGKYVETGSLSQAQAIIDDMFGDYNFFTATTLYSQENFEPFISSPDSNKKGILEVILQFEVYSMAKEYIDNQFKDISKEISVLQREAIMCEGSLEEVKKEESILFERLESEKRELQLAIEEFERLKKSVADENVDEKEIERVKQSIEKHKKIISMLMDEIPAKKSELVKLKSAGDKLSYLQRNLNDIQERLNELSSVAVSSVCPTCGQNLPKKKIDEIAVNYARKSAELHEKKEQLLREMNELKTDSVDLSPLEKEIVALEKKYKEATATLKELQEQLNDYNIVADKLRNLEKFNRAPVIQGKIKSIKESLQRTSSAVAVLEKKLADVNSKLKEYATTSAMYSFWSNGFGNAGIKSMLLDRYCSFLTESINAYLEELTDSLLSISFNSLSSTKKGEVRDKISISVLFGTDEIDYKELSGGQKTILNLAIMLSLRKLASLKRSVLPVIYFDEVFASLDKEHSMKVANLLKEFSDGITTFVVTHDNTLKSNSTSLITFEYLKDESRSVVNFYSIGG